MIWPDMSGGHLQAVLFMMNRPEPIRQSSLLMVLATGVGHGASLLNGLDALAKESSEPWSTKVTQLRLFLEHGSSLSDAIASIPGLLPERTTVAVRVGEKTGTLRQVLTDEALRLMNPGESNSAVSGTLPASLLWLSLVGIVATAIISFQMVFIVPKFKKIFYDFGTDLPAMTSALIDVSDWSLQYWYLVLLPLLSGFAIVAVYATWGHYQYVSHGRLLWTEHIPRYWTPLLLQMLSVTVAARQTVRETLHFMLSELRPGLAATRVSTLRQAVESGEDCFQAMRRLHLLRRREAAFLNAASRNNHVDWGMLHLARTIERRRQVWLGRLTNAMLPTIVILMGLIVGFICIALFLPVIKLTNDLS
ncbi:MAG: type II secretion system F family protein [Planctomycetaceae bacterium]